MSKPLPYMAEPWFDVFKAACSQHKKQEVAARLGVSPAAVAQVFNGSGLYGEGKASTTAFAARVLHRFGSYECPHLSEMFAEPRVITAAECRTHAHQASVPTGSPMALAHWRACNTCAHKPQTAAPVVKPPKSRKAKAAADAAASTSSSTTTSTNTSTTEAQQP